MSIKILARVLDISDVKLFEEYFNVSKEVVERDLADGVVTLPAIIYKQSNNKVCVFDNTLLYFKEDDYLYKDEYEELRYELHKLNKKENK